jgi:ATP-dependent Lon protease
MRAGIRTIILPKKNEKDLEEIPEHIRNQMNFKFIQRMDEAIELALKHTEPRSVEQGAVSAGVS